MPNIETHAAAGLGSGYVVGVLLKLNPDFLVMGFVGALIAAGKQRPVELDDVPKWRQIVMGASSISGAALLSAALTTGAIYALGHKVEDVSVFGACCSACIGYFGTPVTTAITDFIGKTSGLASEILSRLWGKGGNNGS